LVSDEIPWQYACTHVSKEASEDLYEEGEVEGTHVCTMDESCHIVANSLSELVQAIANRFFIPVEEVRADVGNSSPGTVEWLLATLPETVDCNMPSKREVALWKKGKLKLYAADYRFLVEKRKVSPLSEEECQAVGLVKD
jgi:hypothetical protein